MIAHMHDVCVRVRVRAWKWGGGLIAETYKHTHIPAHGCRYLIACHMHDFQRLNTYHAHTHREGTCPCQTRPRRCSSSTRKRSPCPPAGIPLRMKFRVKITTTLTMVQPRGSAQNNGTDAGKRTCLSRWHRLCSLWHPLGTSRGPGGRGQIQYTRVLREARGTRRPCACGCRLVELKLSPLLALVEEDVARDVLRTVNSKNKVKRGNLRSDPLFSPL